MSLCIYGYTPRCRHTLLEKRSLLKTIKPLLLIQEKIVSYKYMNEKKNSRWYTMNTSEYTCFVLLFQGQAWGGRKKCVWFSCFFSSFFRIVLWVACCIIFFLISFLSYFIMYSNKVAVFNCWWLVFCDRLSRAYK